MCVGTNCGGEEDRDVGLREKKHYGGRVEDHLEGGREKMSSMLFYLFVHGN